MLVVFLNVDDLHLLGVLGFGCVARLYIDINKLCHGLGNGICNYLIGMHAYTAAVTP